MATRRNVPIGGAKTCGRHFFAWQTYLQNDPGCWCVRSIETGLMWANPMAMEMLDFPIAVQPWSAAMRWVHIDDVHVVEDAHSRALKTSKPQELQLRVKLDPNHLTLLNNAILASRCNGCVRKCATIVIAIAMADQDADDETAFYDSDEKDSL